MKSLFPLIRLLFAEGNMWRSPAQPSIRNIFQGLAFQRLGLRLRLWAQAENEESADEKQNGRGGEGGLNIEGTPEGADEEAGGKIAESVDGGERAEGHAVLFLGDELGRERIFERFFGANVKSCHHKNQREQPQGMRSCAK